MDLAVVYRAIFTSLFTVFKDQQALEILDTK